MWLRYNFSVVSYKTWTLDSGRQMDRGLDSGLNNGLHDWTRISIAKDQRSRAY